MDPKEIYPPPPPPKKVLKVRGQKDSFDSSNSADIDPSENEPKRSVTYEGYEPPQGFKARKSQFSSQIQNPSGSKYSDNQAPLPEVPRTSEVDENYLSEYLSAKSQLPQQPQQEFISCDCAQRYQSQLANKGCECGTERNAEFTPADPNADQPLQMSKVNLQDYLADNNCDVNNIVFGEPEKENIKALGQALLSMGQRVLNKACSVPSGPPSRGQGTGRKSTLKNPQCCFERGCQCSECQPENPQPFYQTDSAQTENDCSAESWLCDIEKAKKEFIEAFGKICYSIGLAKECKKKEGLPEQNFPLDAGEEILAAEPVDETQLLTKSFQQLSDRVTLLEVKFNELDEQVGELINTVLKQNMGITGKMTTMEGDILQMAKLIHELQCVTKLQMHLGTTQGT